MLALRYISATRFAIFQPLIPCIASFISIMLGIDEFTVIKLTGICIAVGGAVMAVVWNAESDESELNVPLGTAIASFQIFAMACLVVFQKKLLSRYESTTLTFIYYSIGGVLTLLLDVGVLVVWYLFDWGMAITLKDLTFDSNAFVWMGLLYAASFATLFPYNAMAFACKILAPSVTTVYCTIQPVGTILLSLIILQVVVTLPEGLGCCLVVIGLFITVYGQLREKKMRAQSRGKSGDSDMSFLEVLSAGNDECFENGSDEYDSEEVSSDSVFAALNPVSNRKDHDNDSSDTERTVAWQTSGRRSVN
jgi:drug/metabolite transporter (DMT)-like permease